MFDIWYYDPDGHSTGIITVDTIEELHEWFISNGGPAMSVLVTNICKHREDTGEED